MTQRPRPWFHRHPGLAGCGVLGVLLALPALGAAAALRWQASQPAPAAAATPPPSTVRTLRLKEHPPGMEAEVEPGDEYLSHTDGLSGEPVQLRIDHAIHHRVDRADHVRFTLNGRRGRARRRSALE